MRFINSLRVLESLTLPSGEADAGEIEPTPCKYTFVWVQELEGNRQFAREHQYAIYLPLHLYSTFVFLYDTSHRGCLHQGGPRWYLSTHYLGSLRASFRSALVCLHKAAGPWSRTCDSCLSVEKQIWNRLHLTPMNNKNERMPPSCREEQLGRWWSWRREGGEWLQYMSRSRRGLVRTSHLYQFQFVVQHPARWFARCSS